jgi:hypothetical protein
LLTVASVSPLISLRVERVGVASFLRRLSVPYESSVSSIRAFQRKILLDS